MFIMTNIDVNKDLVRVFDTSDNTNDVVKLSSVLPRVLNGKLKVAGLSNNARYPDSILVSQAGVYASIYDAKVTMANLLIKEGLSQQDAYKRVGIV